MNAKELFNKEGKSVNIWQCGSCETLFVDEDCCNRCCVCFICKQPLDHKKEASRNYHSQCRLDDMFKRSRELMEKAEEVSSSEVEQIYIEGFGQEYFTIDELEEYCYDEEIELPEFAFVCQVDKIKLDIIDHINGILEDLFSGDYEVSISDLNGCNELEEAVKIFEELNSNFSSYYPDFTKKVKLR